MDALALEATGGKKKANGTVVAAPLPAQPSVKRKPAKKAKKAVVFFEVEILDAKTKDKLCFLDKVRTGSSSFYPIVFMLILAVLSSSLSSAAI